MAAKIRNKRWAHDQSLEEALRNYSRQGFQKIEILSFMVCDFGEYAWSLRFLDRRWSCFNILSNDKSISVEDVKSAVNKKLMGPGRLLSYHVMHLKIKSIGGVSVPRDFVYAATKRKANLSMQQLFYSCFMIVYNVIAMTRFSFFYRFSYCKIFACRMIPVSPLQMLQTSTMAVFGHEEDRFKTKVHWSFIISINKTIKLRFVFKKKYTVSAHIIFYFKMNLVFVETFLDKTYILQKKKEWKKKKKRFLKLFINLLWQHSATILVLLKNVLL